jgi:hypothetical protein
MTRANVPLGDVLAVATVSVEVPPPFTEPGENVQVLCAGQPVTLNPTMSLNPLSGVTETVKLPELPRLIFRLFGDAVIVKSATSAGLP